MEELYPLLTKKAKANNVDIEFYAPFKHIVEEILELASEDKLSVRSFSNVTQLLSSYYPVSDINTDPIHKGVIETALLAYKNNESYITKSWATTLFGRKFINDFPYYVEVNNPHYKSAAKMKLYYRSVIDYCLKHTKELGMLQIKSHSLEEQQKPIVFFERNLKVKFNKAKIFTFYYLTPLLPYSDEQLSYRLNNRFLNIDFGAFYAKLNFLEKTLDRYPEFAEEFTYLYFHRNKINKIVELDGKTYAFSIKGALNLTADEIRQNPTLIEDFSRFLESDKGKRELKKFEEEIAKREEIKLAKISFLRNHLTQFLFHNKTIENNLHNKVFNFYIGPTNSGKTFNALEQVKALLAHNPQAKIAYLAPLRLLAIEIYERMNQMGIACSLMTGEETIIEQDACMVSATIEMLNSQQYYDMVIIDEYQMIDDRDRGQSWVSAILNSNTDNLYLLGSDSAFEKTKKLIEITHPLSTINVRCFNRLSKIKLSNSTIHIASLRKGDCLVVFSKNKVIQYSEILNNLGVKTSILYGDLPLETRRLQSEDFKNGVTDVLVSTDVIGMGLNLPINRIIFEDCQKFDGEDFRPLKVEEYKQIAGRSGRYNNDGETFMLSTKNLAFSPFSRSIVYNDQSKKQSDWDYEDYERTKPLLTKNMADLHNIMVSMNKEFKEENFQMDGVYTTPYLLPVNPRLVEAFAQTFNLKIAEAHLEYKNIFKQIQREEDCELLSFFTLNDKTIYEILSKYEGMFKELGCNILTTYTMATPPINFYERDRYSDSEHISAIGDKYLRILSDKFDPNALHIKQFINEMMNHKRGFNQFNEQLSIEYAEREKKLILLSWINKHFKLVDTDQLRHARYTFAIEYFKLIFISKVMKAFYSKQQQKLQPLEKELRNIDSKRSKLLNEIKIIQNRLKKHKNIKNVEQLEHELSVKKELLGEFEKQNQNCRNRIKAEKSTYNEKEKEILDQLIKEVDNRTRLYGISLIQ